MLSGGAVYGAVGDAVSGAVRGAVRDAVGDAVSGAVRDAVGDAVRGAVSGAVYGAVRGAVGGAVRDAVGDAVGGAVRDAVGDAVRGAVYGAVYGAVRGAVGDAVRDAVGDAVRGAVSGAVRDAVGDAVYGAVYGAVRDAVSGAVRDAVGDAVRGAQWHYWFGGQFWVFWQAFEKFFREVVQLQLTPDIIDRAEAYEMAQTSANYWWPNKKFVIVCNRPNKISRNNSGQLHCNDDMAIQYRDGWGLYVLNGVRVTAKIVMTPAHELDPMLVLKEKNAEIRREIVRKIGVERLIQKLHGNIINKWGDYELITLKIPGMSIVPTYLKMRNPSIGTWHVEGVPPNIKTCQEALSWRCGGIKWEPEQLT